MGRRAGSWSGRRAYPHIVGFLAARGEATAREVLGYLLTVGYESTTADNERPLRDAVDNVAAMLVDGEKKGWPVRRVDSGPRRWEGTWRFVEEGLTGAADVVEPEAG